jgi:hypothetical protein
MLEARWTNICQKICSFSKLLQCIYENVTDSILFIGSRALSGGIDLKTGICSDA